MARDPFENELFDALNEYNSPLNKKEAWVELESKLPKKKKKRFIPFWLNMFAMFLLAGIILYAFSMENYDFKNAENTVNPVHSQVATNAPNKMGSTVVEDNAPHSNTLLSEKTTAEIKSQKSSFQIKKTQSNESNLISDKQKTISKALTFNTKTSVSPIILKEYSNQAIPFNNRNLNTSQDISIIPSEQESIRHPLALTKRTKISNLSRLFTPFHSLQLRNNPFNAAANFAKRPNNFNTPSVPIALWEIKIQTEYGKSSLDRTGGMSQVQNEIADWIQSKEDERDYFSFGLEIQRQIHTYFSIYTGINSSVNRSTFNYNDQLNVRREKDNVLFQRDFYLDGSIIDKTRTQEVDYKANIEASLVQSYRQVSIPIGVSIHSPKQKSYYVQADIGIQFSIFQRNSGRLILLENDDYQIVKNSDFQIANFQSLNSKLFIGKNLTSGYSIQFGIASTLDLKSRLNESTAHSFKIKQTGIYLGLSKLL